MAGVSRGTVDRVLHKRGNVSAKTYKKIMDIVDTFGYKPNAAAQNLTVKKKNIKIGIVMPSGQNVFYVDVIHGLQEYAARLAEMGIKVFFRHINGYDPKQEIHEIDSLLEDGINGLIIMPFSDDAVNNKLEEVTGLGIPIVTIISDCEMGDKLCYVGSDFNKCGRIAAGLMGKFLKGEGSILVIIGSHKMLSHKQRLQSFSETIKKDYPSVKILDVVENYEDDFKSYSLIKEYFQKYDDIDAVYIIAGGSFGACKAIKELALERKPFVVCYEDMSEVREMLLEGIVDCAICQCRRQIGISALEIMRSYLVNRVKPHSKYNIIDVEIKIRESLDA